MKYISIRSFEEEDVSFACKLNMMEQWGDTESDIKQLLNYEPDGCFIAEVNNESVGHVFSISYGRLGWIELLIVKAEYRRKGIGTLLMEKTLVYLLSRGVKTIELEAVPAMSDLYQKLGFTGEYDSLRFMGTSGNFAPLSGHSMTLIEKKRHAYVILLVCARFSS